MTTRELPRHSRLLTLTLILLNMSYLAACSTSSQDTPLPVYQAVTETEVPTVAATFTQVALSEPTYAVYHRMVEATAIAIAQTLATPTLIPNIRPDIQEDRKNNYLANSAFMTAVAQNPYPADSDPRSEMTPIVYLTPLPTEASLPSRPTENGDIYDLSLEDNPIGKMLYSVNYWIGSIDSERLGVYAGHSSSDPTQGLLIVRESIVENGEPKYRFTDYITSSRLGPVRIISETGGQLTLQVAGSSQFYFDLATRQWVSPPLPTPSLSILPLPTMSPLP